MSGLLAGKVALVTGASRGIGAAVVRRFAAEGAEIIAIARNQPSLEELDDEIRAKGGKPLVLVPEDVRTPDVIDRVAAAIFDRWGRLDALVGNAGVVGGGLRPVAHLEPRVWDEMIAVNLSANWRLIRAMDPLLRMSEAGRAVFTAAAEAHEAPAFWGGYAASKAGLEAMVRCWAAEVANVTSLRINLLDPGPVATRLRTIAYPGEDQTRLTQPDAVAGAFLALCLPSCERHGDRVLAADLTA
ncbi:SDR family NAD(P)-dependent oxidoreductase [Magnetospirillum fulvum]|uniref:NADP-dependent 3-hydroxy acid dehydrogenase YdfG n=1 Tax=Magnetospirillum fulvum TaxID=1082 RepID=A0A1H6H9S6_MAGFU|nr:SDR family NAD(P)-dependent oxidoreductase [Magnetospirillum fulvum]SEH31004.1 NADP-dependent 3-hydroxy acid dehydrogenase YdfG [Magnetospirillum fulvum]